MMNPPTFAAWWPLGPSLVGTLWQPHLKEYINARYRRKGRPTAFVILWDIRHGHSYWLIPAEPVRTECRRVIEDLAGRYSAPPFEPAPQFEPHVTIYFGT